MTYLAVNVLSPESLIQTFGTIGVIAIIFAETGLLVGFFLPGDSLLFAAGVACSTHASDKVHLPLALVLPGVAIAAVVGAQTGYVIGRRAGPVLFDRPDSRLFKRENVEKAEHHFTRYGPGKAVFLARFVPFVRTFMNPVAGVLEMPVRTFAAWNVAGGLIWSIGLTMLGYGLGKSFSGNIDRIILPAVAVLVALSLTPIVIEVVKRRRARLS